MIVGIDVYHDSERKGQSVVGIVSSLNKNASLDDVLYLLINGNTDNRDL